MGGLVLFPADHDQIKKLTERQADNVIAEFDREMARLKASNVLGEGETYPIPTDTFTSLDVDETLASAYQISVETLYKQRAVDEANEAARAAALKEGREAKANNLREQARQQRETEAKAAAARAYKIKKEMAVDTKAARTTEEERKKKMQARGMEERKKNDEYNEWLGKDHIRTVAERGHERADPSKMHEGGKFSGIPTDFTPGK